MHLHLTYSYLHQPYSLSPKLLYVYNIKFKLCAKHVLTVRELFSMVVNKIIFQNMIMACKIPPPHGKCHLKIPFFGRLPLGRPKFGHCLPLFCFHACSIWFDFCNYEQSKTKWKRHLEHCLWYGSFSRPKFGHCLLFFVFMIVYSLGQSL